MKLQENFCNQNKNKDKTFILLNLYTYYFFTFITIINLIEEKILVLKLCIALTFFLNDDDTIYSFILPNSF